MSELYAVRVARPGPAAAVGVVGVSVAGTGGSRGARGYAACHGGGRWRVYGTRVAAVGDGPVEVVLGPRLAEGLQTHRQD